MELRQLRFALVLAEELHFGRAAAREHIAQAAFSEQIQRLERELGVQLFERTTRQVRLTAFGATLIERAQVVVDLADAMSDEAARLRRGEAGRLVVGLSVTAAQLGPALVRTFHDRYPQVHTKTRQVSFLNPAAGLHAGTVDVALLWAPIEEHGLARVALRTEARLAVLPDDHPLAGRADVGIAELLDDVWCGCPATDQVWLDFWLANDHRGGRPVRYGGTANSLDGVIETVAAGQGIALVPAALRRIGLPGVTFVPVTDIPPCELSLAWPAASTNPAVLTFVDLAVALSAGEDWSAVPIG